MARTIALSLTANVQGLVAGLRTAQRATSDFARQTQRWTQQNEQHLNTMGGAAGKAGAIAAAGLALVGKAAMDWESSWAGVLKTVDATPAGLRELEGGLRGLAKTLPSTHGEIASVAEAAGQLGVKAGDVVGFTKVMIDLGQSTNLSAEEGATSLARFSNVMGTSVSDVGRLGATLVGLGNNFATTESEIMAMSMRLAGAGKQIGLSEGETMGLAAAMSSVGIEAEAGGSAMSTTMKRIGKAVDEGGSSLDTFAKTAGMTSEDFAAKWKSGAAGGIEAFTSGLGRAGEAGESVNAILSELGITGIREADALLRLSSAGELMGEAMKQGAMEYEAGTALIEEANKRYETAESKVKVAWNGIKDAAIEAGTIILPVIVAIAEGVTDMASAFASIPKPIQAFVLGLMGVAAVGGLGIAALSKLAVGSSNVVTAFTAMVPAGSRARGVIGKVGKAAGIASLALGALAIGAIFSDKAVKSSGDYAQSIVKVAKAGEQAKASDLDSLFSGWDKMFGKETIDGLDSAAEAIARITTGLKWDDAGNEWADKAFAWTGLVDSETSQIKNRLVELGAEMGSLANSGHGEQAAATFKLLATEFQNNERSAQDALNFMPDYADALKKIAAEAGVAVTESELLEWAMTGVAPAAVSAAQGLDAAGGAVGYVKNAMNESIPVSQETAEALAEIGISAAGSITGLSAFTEFLFASGLAVMSSRDAAFQWSDTLRDLDGDIKEVLKTQGKLGPALNKTKDDFNKTTDSGAAANKVFTDKLREGMQVASTFASDASKSQADVQKQMESTYKAGVKTAEGFGLSKKAAVALTRETLQIPAGVSIESWFSTAAKDEAEALTGAVQAVPTKAEVQFQSNVDDLSAKILALHEKIQGTKGKSIEIKDNSPETKKAMEELGYIVTKLPNGKIKVSEEGTDATGKKIDNAAGKKRIAVINATAATGAAESALNQLARNRNATITVTTSGGSKMSGPGVVVRPGQVGAHATGGPISGPGTGTSDSIPAWLSNGEHVWTAEEVRRLGGHGAVEGLREMAMRGKIPAFATGGRVGWSQGKDAQASKVAADATAARKRAERDLRIAEGGVKAADKASTSASRKSADTKGGKGNEGAKAAAKADARRAADDKKAASKSAATARKDLARAKKAEDAAKKKLQDSKARTARLSEGAFDLRRDLKRGTIMEAFTSGNGMSMVDRMFDASNNKDLSKGQRKAVRAQAYATESQLLKLEKDAAKVERALNKAVAERDRLLDARNNVRDAVKGSFDLGDLVGQKDAFGDPKKFTKQSALAYAKEKAAGAKKLRDKIKKLQGMGFGPDMIQMAIDEWTGSGTFEVADALATMSKAEVKSMNSAYSAMSTYGRQTGDALTNAMAKGGLNAAQTLVDTVKAQEKNVNNAFYQLGKAGEAGFKRAWGIASPSKVMTRHMDWIGQGGVNGLKAQEPAMAKAMAGLMAAPKPAELGAFAVPASAEVARYTAAAPAQQAPALPPIYIQSPVTGEYLLAKTAEIALAAVGGDISTDHRNNSRGGVHAGRY